MALAWRRSFGNKVWFAVSLENAQATLTTHNNAANFLLGSAGAGGGLYNGAITTCSTALNSTDTAATTTCSPAASVLPFNPSPDVIAKLAFEPGFGHYEVFGVFSRFRDRVFRAKTFLRPRTASARLLDRMPRARTTLRRMAAVSALTLAGRLPARKSTSDCMASAALESAATAPVDFLDVTVRDDGTLGLIKSLQGLATFEWHGPKLDVYFNAGAEYAGRSATYDPVLKKAVGYGSPQFNNTGCFTETGPVNNNGFLPGGLSSCTADTRVLIEGTAGFWYRIYNGPKGRIQWGPQYSYVVRNAWSGTSSPNQPHGLDSMIFTSFRYYLP